jgi:hypothetical protein
MIMMSLIFRPSQVKSLMNIPFNSVQCSQNSQSVQIFVGSRKSINGSAYFERLAVKITTSKRSLMLSRNSVTNGRIRTNTSRILDSISTFKTICGFGIGTKDECTKVSSKSKMRVLRCAFEGCFGPSKFDTPSGMLFPVTS